MEPKKILLVITQLELGGAQKAIFELARGLYEKGWRVEVVIMYDKGNFKEIFEKKYGVDVTDLDMKGTGLIRLFKIIKGLIALSIKIRKGEYSIVQSFTHFSNIIIPIVSWFSGRSLRYTAQRAKVTDLPRVISVLDRIVANSFLTHKMSCVSESVLESCVKDQKIKRDKLVAIPNGIDVSKFSIDSGRANDQPLNIVCVARLHRQKGHQFLLEAMVAVNGALNGNVVLNLIGDGELEGELKQQVEGLGLKSAVNFLGNQNNVPEILSHADILVLPSLWEGMPNVLLEAMAAGLPVVATSVDGSSEVVEDLVTGFLVDKQDHGQLSKALIKLGLDGKLRRDMGEQGRKRVISNYSLSSFINAFDELYLTALKK